MPRRNQKRFNNKNHNGHAAHHNRDQRNNRRRRHDKNTPHGGRTYASAAGARNVPQNTHFAHPSPPPSQNNHNSQHYQEGHQINMLMPNGRANGMTNAQMMPIQNQTPASLDQQHGLLGSAPRRIIPPRVPQQSYMLHAPVRGTPLLPNQMILPHQVRFGQGPVARRQDWAGNHFPPNHHHHPNVQQIPQQSMDSHPSVHQQRPYVQQPSYKPRRQQNWPQQQMSRTPNQVPSHPLPGSHPFPQHHQAHQSHKPKQYLSVTPPPPPSSSSSSSSPSRASPFARSPFALSSDQLHPFSHNVKAFEQWMQGLTDVLDHLSTKSSSSPSSLSPSSSSLTSSSHPVVLDKYGIFIRCYKYSELGDSSSSSGSTTSHKNQESSTPRPHPIITRLHADFGYVDLRKSFYDDELVDDGDEDEKVNELSSSMPSITNNEDHALPQEYSPSGDLVTGKNVDELVGFDSYLLDESTSSSSQSNKKAIISRRNQCLRMTYEIANQSNDNCRVLWITMPEREQFTVTDHKTGKEYPLDHSGLTLRPQTSIFLDVSCSRQENASMCLQWMVFCFEHVSNGALFDWNTHSFVIARKNVVINCNKADMTALDSESRPFYPKSLKSIFSYSNINTGGKHHFAAQEIKFPEIDVVFSLPKQIVPQYLKYFNSERILQEGSREATRAWIDAKREYFANTKQELSNALNIKPSLLEEDSNNNGVASSSTSTSSSSTYDPRIKMFNHLSTLQEALLEEEMQMDRDVSIYDIFNAELELVVKHGQKSELVYLPVPGVGERRPNLCVGDAVAMRIKNMEGVLPADEKNLDRVTAYVAAVQEARIMLSFPLLKIMQEYKCSSREDLIKKLRVHAHFSYQETPFQYMHRALHLVLSSTMSLSSRSVSLIFPKVSDLAFLVSAGSSENPQQFSLQERENAIAKDAARITAINPNCNNHQLCAVHHIIQRSCHPIPYIIFGPPGTGKTMTLVEAIMQTLWASGISLKQTASSSSLERDLKQKEAGSSYSKEHVRMLICTPSDYSADIVAQRLTKWLEVDQILRLNKQQRHTSVDPSLLPYCLFDSGMRVYSIPSIDDLRSYQVIVCTCMMAGLLKTIGVESGEFTHIFLDESCQALEPETLIPLSLAGDNTQVVLCGDHMQLGAEVHSPDAAKLGLTQSLQERLLHCCQVYKSNDRRMIMQLVNNYRAHPSLLNVTSHLFYNSSLRSMANRQLTGSLSQWPLLPNKHNFPLMFYGIIGQDIYEQESSSFYNPVEASKVVELVQALVGSAGENKSANSSSSSSSLVSGISHDDIGVIAPYRKQVLQLRHLLRSKNLGNIRVGSVDDYQGKEEKIIIISTVLSKWRHKLFSNSSVSSSSSSFPSSSSSSSSSSNTSTLSPTHVCSPTYNAAVPLGIMRDDKRFNVALSRAKALTIIVGNPNMLMHENRWAQLLQYCVDNDAYVGGDQCPCPVAPSSSNTSVLGGGLIGFQSLAVQQAQRKIKDDVNISALLPEAQPNIKSQSGLYSSMKRQPQNLHHDHDLDDGIVDDQTAIDIPGITSFLGEDDDRLGW